jgi:peptidoglycan/LPS O-acetylase OafA/YrhL
LVGVLAYKICSRERLSPLQGAALVLGMSAIYVIYKIWPHYSGLSLNIMPDIFGMPVWQTRYFVGVLFALHIVGFHAMAGWVTPLLMRFERPIRWCAGATFTIYLFHLPVAQFLSTLVPWPPGSWATRLVMLGGTLLILFGIAELTERRKDAWRRGIAALVGRFAVPGRQPG